MCLVSNIGDNWSNHWKQNPNIQPYIGQPTNPLGLNQFIQTVPKSEFDKLKKEFDEMKKQLVEAKILDEKNGEPNCEMEDKVALLKKVASLLGCNLDEVFK